MRFKKSFDYVDHKYSYYGTTHFTHIFEDEDHNVFVWKTTNPVEYIEDEFYKAVTIGSLIRLTGTIKEIGEYKGTPQTVLSRCKVELIERAKTKAEIRADKRKEQLASLKGEDFIWTMPYKQYKEHYSDCETVVDSYEDYTDSFGRATQRPTIDVIIREGRLKASGSRGKHYHTFIFENADGSSKIAFYAISEETATKQLLRNGHTRDEFPTCYIRDYN